MKISKLVARGLVLLLLLTLTSCSKTLLSTLITGSVGLVGGGIGGYQLAENFCFGCGKVSRLKDEHYGAIIGASSGLTLFSVAGALIGSYFEDQSRIKQGASNQLVVGERDIEAETKGLYFSACRLGDESVVNRILETNAEYIDLVDANGKTGLHWAAEWGRYDTVKALVYQEVQLDIQDQKGKTALHYSVANRHAATSEFLIHSGASLDIADKDGKLSVDYIANIIK